LLSVNQLYFTRDTQVLFENFEFIVNPGELLQIQGMNGTGKTTLLKLLAGFLTPDSGDIFFQDTKAYIGHTPAFTPWLSVQENIELNIALYHQDAQNMPVVLEQFSLQPQALLFPHQLSQGQKRRLGFALLSLSGARLWLLDEPFTALDTGAVNLIQRLIVEHLARQGLVVMSTHQEISWPIAVRQIVLGKCHSEVYANIPY
jgi:heme exporter protein A